MFPEFLSTQSNGEEDPTERKGEVTGDVNILGVEDPMKREPAIDDVAVVDVEVNEGRRRNEYRVDVASWEKFPTPCMERIDPGVVDPSPILELELSQTRESEFERFDDDVQYAILFDCPPERPPAQRPSEPLKHPDANWMPFENVEVPVVDVILRRCALNPPEKVDVEFVPLTSRNPDRVEVAFVFDVVRKSDSRTP